MSGAGILGVRGNSTGWVWYDRMPAVAICNLRDLETIGRPPGLPFGPERLGRHKHKRAHRKKPKSRLAYFDDRTQAVVQAR